MALDASQTIFAMPISQFKMTQIREAVLIFDGTVV